MEAAMSDDREARRVPKMAPEKAQEIARDLKWLAQDYAEAGMSREAQRAERDSQWWLAYSISLAATPPAKT
jgi:hypothetical protein